MVKKTGFTPEQHRKTSKELYALHEQAEYLFKDLKDAYGEEPAEWATTIKTAVGRLRSFLQHKTKTEGLSEEEQRPLYYQAQTPGKRV